MAQGHFIELSPDFRSERSLHRTDHMKYVVRRSFFCLAVESMLTMTACSDIASSTRSTATALVAASPVEITAVAGAAVVELPAVTVVDSRGNPVAGVNVTFTSSDGSTFPVVARSGLDGIARVASWLAPHEAGTSAIYAKSVGLQIVRFALATTAGPAASLQKFSGDRQVGYANESLPLDPSVRVTDAFGNAVAGVHVVFAIDSGEGSLKTPSTSTNSDGEATAVGWTLKSVGRHAISSNVTGLDPQEFTAVAVESPERCGGRRDLAAGTTFREQLTAEDCTDGDGRLFELLGMTIGQDEYVFSLTSSDFDTALRIVDLYGTPIATNDTANAGSTNSRISGLFPVGRVTAVVSAARAGGGGLFAIGYERGSSSGICDPIFTMRGISAERVVRGAQCPGITMPTDQYRIFLRAGEEVTVSILDHTYSAWQATMYNSTGELVSTSNYAGSYVERLTFTPPADGYYNLTIACGDTNGEYRLTIR